MTRPRSETMLRAAVVCMLVIGTAGLGMNRVVAHMRGRAVHGYVPNTAVPRLAFQGDSVHDAILIRDFDATTDELYLLDMAAPRVIVMHEDSGHWSVVHSFGRHGGGPGELMQPTGIAVMGDSVFVMDHDRIHMFDRDGHYIATRTPALPCAMMDPRVYAAARGIMLSGRCIRGDTVAGELMLASNDIVIPIAHDALYTTDGSVGSPFAAGIQYSPGATHGLFGGGTGDCIYSIANPDPANPTVAPIATRVCGLATTRYAFVATPEFRAKVKALAAARPFAAGALAVPLTLPPYMAALATTHGDFVARPYSNDSLAFRRIDSTRDVMIAETEGLVGCKQAGCLWIRQGLGVQVMFVPAAVIEGARDIDRR